MPNEISIKKSSTAYSIAIFIIAVVWVIIGIEQAYATMITIIINPLNWFLVSTSILISMILPVAFISYNWKQQLIFSEPNWNVRIREIEISEFKRIMNDYKQAYSSFIKQFDYYLFTLLMISGILSILFPLAFPFSLPLLIWGPFLYAGLLLFTILLLAKFVFKAAPNSATPFFRMFHEKSLRKLVIKLWDTNGISWAGIRLQIGRAGDYYIIQEAKAVGRIDGIESISRIECESDETGIYSASSIIDLGPVDGTKTISLDSEYNTLETLDLNELVKRTVILYAQMRGVNEVLEDVMLDLGIRFSEKDDS